MMHNRFPTLAPRLIRLLVLLMACTSPTESESKEGGQRYQLTDTARQTRSGVDLVMSYDSGQQRFTGTVTNTTNSTAPAVRVEIHLSNGVELGPTPRSDLAAGAKQAVELDARGQSFDWWSVHVEMGGGGGG